MIVQKTEPEFGGEEDISKLKMNLAHHFKCSGFKYLIEMHVERSTMLKTELGCLFETEEKHFCHCWMNKVINVVKRGILTLTHKIRKM